MSRLTPPIGISGAFLLRDPFSVSADKSYTVTAIRKFSEVIARGQDPVKMIYEPVSLGTGAYEQDVAAGALVICLQDKEGRTTYVPDTYIESYPSMGSVPYHRVVMGVSLGMWPEHRGTEDVQDAIAQAVEDFIGVTPEVIETRAPTSDYMSEQQHVQLTSVRQSAIISRETPRATILRLSEQLVAMQATIDEQASIIEALANN